jgi:hypothetical protein
MSNPPNTTQLLSALYHFLSIGMMKDKRRLAVETQVAAQLVKIVEREIMLSIPHDYAEWERINGIQGTDIAPPDATAIHDALSRRNEALAEAIRQGKYDDAHGRAALLAHFLVTTQEQLEIVSPRYLQDNS